MSVESCGVDGDGYEELVGFAREVSWNGHTVTDEVDLDFVRRCPVPTGKSVGGSVEAKKDQEGNSSVAAEGHFTAKDDKGNKGSVSAEVSVKRDAEGKVSTEGSATLTYDKDF